MPAGAMRCTWRSEVPGGGCGSALLGLGGLRFGFAQALHVLAGALGDVLPVLRRHVFLGLAGAGVRAAQVGAVVLAGLGDAVALLLGLVLRRHLADEAEREGGSEGGRDDQALVHGN